MPRIRPALWLLPALVFGLLQAAAAPAARTLPELRRQLAGHLAATAAPGAVWGVKVVSLATAKTLFATNEAKLLTPASDTKLFTAALALDRLGADHRVSTSLRARTAPAPDGTLSGDLSVVGGGDPTLNGRLHGGRWESALAPLVGGLVSAGVKRITGDLVCDESAFRGPPYGSGWDEDYLVAGYGAAVSALTFNDNIARVIVSPGKAIGQSGLSRIEPAFPPDGEPPVVLRNHVITTSANDKAARVRTARSPGSSVVELEGELAAGGRGFSEEVAVTSPAAYFGAALRTALRQHGISVAGRMRVVGWRERAAQPADGGAWRDLVVLPSPAVGALVKETLKPSQNLYAQLLLLAVGLETERHPTDVESKWPPAETTEAAGLRALDAFLRSVGIAKGEAVFEEGSGLSRKNMATPSAVTRLLLTMDKHRWASEWRDALPVGGVDGTLRDRFRTGPAKGNVRAKTGSLRHVGALSGYVTTAAGERLAFSILVNNFTGAGASSPRGEIDVLVEALAAFTGRSE